MSQGADLTHVFAFRDRRDEVAPTALSAAIR